MAFIESIRKLMGWCPMKKSLWKRKQEDNYPDFKLENRIVELGSSPVNLQESRIFKAQVNLFPDWWALIILVFALIISLLLWTYSPESSFLIILSKLVLYLSLIVLLLSHHPSTVAVMPEKIIVKRPIRKPVVIEKKDIIQISVTRNENRSLRWPTRLVFLVTLPIILLRTVERIVRDLQLEAAASASAKLSLFLSQSLTVTYLLVFFYYFELRAPYQQTLKVTTYSNLKLWIYTEKPEELTKLLNFGI
ncbi:hypothetical protein MSSIT_3885 [Methanosarcina siciliae T4/M]|uniref:DUF1673 family protein n=1 Tax=Methanosarcina siciliae T4/M TaxID=1434120 RepID=A0A0E3P9F8_9EURY|nr:DUF1673 family protein [Methanosarcina siciliae]AKB30604.1 hypothetical protein MSSIT_3885 [Methanosarcina siciliae T4/M]